MASSLRVAAVAGGLLLLGLVLGACEATQPAPQTVPPGSAEVVRTGSPASGPRATATPLSSVTPVQAGWRPSSQGIPAQIGVAAVTVAPSAPRTIYLAGYEPGGMYRSDDGGTSWRSVSEGLESRAPLAVAIDPTNRDAAWVGTMAGAFRTIDGGEHWFTIPDLPQVPIYALAVAPSGDLLFAGGETAAVWRSEDHGQTWTASDLGAASVLSLAVAADRSVFAGTAGQGLWVSSDGGTTWQMVEGGLDSAHVTVLSAREEDGLDAAEMPAVIVYAVADGALYASRDGGERWESLAPPGFEVLSFAAEPARSERLYLGSKGNGLAVSPDGGRSWLALGSELRHADVTCMVADPATPGRAYLGTRHHGLYATDDGGQSWHLLTSEVGRLVVMALLRDPDRPHVLYAGTLDGVYRSEDYGEHWHLVSGAMGRLSVHDLAASPAGDRLYAATRTGVYVSDNGGRTWRWATEEMGILAAFSLVVDPHDPQRIYAGTWGHNVLHSTDGGRTWASIHHGLETLSVHAFAVDPADARVLYAGTVEAVYRSTDGGEQWQAHALAERPLTTFALAVSPAHPSRVYAGTTEGVVRSGDGGQSWLPVGRESLQATVTSLLLDPSDPETIYAGTEHHGLFRSTNGGEDWQPWGLEEASVYALLADPSGALWVGTDEGVFRRP